MPYIIDGHNLIGQMPDISLSEIDDELLLINILEKYFKLIRKKAFVFFDRGNLDNNKSYKSAFLEVKFVRPPTSADEAIIQKLESLRGNARNYILISSDNWVINHARKFGTRVISTKDFSRKLMRIEGASKNKMGDDENDIDYWLDIFGQNLR